MTVYSGTLSRPFHVQDKHQTVSVKIENASVFRLNLILLSLATVAVLTYIFISNFLVAQRYALNLHKSELNQLNAKLTTGGLDNGGQDLGVLLRFAKNYGLVEAKDTDSILEKDGLAIFDQ